MVHGNAERLQDENVRPPHVLLDADTGLLVGKLADERPTDGEPKMARDPFGERRIGVPTEDLQGPLGRPLGPALHHSRSAFRLLPRRDAPGMARAGTPA